MSKVYSCFHIVFCTKCREMTIRLENKEELYRFIWRRIQDLNCNLVRIGGIQNHVHILVDLHPSVALADLVRDIKSVSCTWLRNNKGILPEFNGWADGYFAAVIPYDGRSSAIEYVKNQESHHHLMKTEEEMDRLFGQVGLIRHQNDLM